MPGAGEGLGVWSAIGSLEHPLPPDCLSWVHVPQISLVSQPAENLGGFPQGVLAISHPPLPSPAVRPGEHPAHTHGSAEVRPVGSWGPGGGTPGFGGFEMFRCLERSKPSGRRGRVVQVLGVLIPGDRWTF